MKRAFVIDYKICFDCKSCEVACKQENNISDSAPAWIKVITVGPREVGDKILVDFVPTACVHCAKPPCADTCPTKAIEKREDGIVVIDAELCIGCMACLPACPFGVMQFNAEKGIAEKCNMCLNRITKDRKPACVHHCPSGALLFGEINEVCYELRQRHAQRIGGRIDSNTHEYISAPRLDL